MKNKSKLQKIKEQNKGGKLNLPDGWFLMAKEETDVKKLGQLFSDYNVEVWPEAGVCEIEIGEKASVDIEAMEADLGDDYSNAFLKKNAVKSLFYISFKKEVYEQAKEILKLLSTNIDGFVCGDTDNFEPRL